MKKNRMKTTLMNTLKIACAGLMLLFMTPAAHAESALAWLPFSIEPGKPLPDKAKRKLSKEGSTYTLSGKFYVSTEDDVVHYFSIMSTKPDDSDEHYSVPKRWGRLGMRLCTKNQKGASLDAMRTMAKKEGAKYFEVDSSDKHLDILTFEIGGKYEYDLRFLVRHPDTLFSDECKGGLLVIHVGEAVGEEY